MGKTYDVKIAPAAQRQLKKIPQPARGKIIKCLESLSENPRPNGVEKLSQDPRLWRIRVNDYRVIYYIDDESALIVTLIVRHRKDAYRDLDKLDPTVIAKSLFPLLTGLAIAS